VSIRPEAFWSTEEPLPERPTGSECENGVQGGSSGIFVQSTTLERLGYPNHSGYMGSAGGSGRIYSDVGHLEYATAEVLGPAAAAVEDLKGMERVADIVARAPYGVDAAGNVIEPTNYDHRGVYRTAGTYIPNGSVAYQSALTSAGVTSGHHLNLLFPRVVAYDPLFKPLLATVLSAKSIWAGGGALREEGFVFSQKVWGAGGDPVVLGMGNRTAHGGKPMAMVPDAGHDADTIGDTAYARNEVRNADPHFSLVAAFLEFAALSLTLRLLEIQQAGARDARDKLGRQHLATFCLEQPVKAGQLFAGDLTLRSEAATHDGSDMSALDINKRLLESIELLPEVVQLPAAELLAIDGLRAVVDGLSNSHPDQRDYDRRVLLAVDYAPRHLFVAKGKESAAVTAHNVDLMRRDLLWGQIVADPAEVAREQLKAEVEARRPREVGCYGKRYWASMNERHELTPQIRHLAEQSGLTPRALARAAMVDAGGSAKVRNWAHYVESGQTARSFGSVFGYAEAS
jgi:hypothetical protein